LTACQRKKFNPPTALPFAPKTFAARFTKNARMVSGDILHLYKKTIALSAWFWVEATMFSFTAKCVKKALISRSPISRGCLLLWRRMNFLFQET
jgi:hypothetical protein